MKFFDSTSLIAQGITEPSLTRQYPFQRIPDQYQESLRKELWGFSENSAGVSITFQTNSSQIRLQWKIKLDFKMNHMANTGIKGLDLYQYKNNNWYYSSTGIPISKNNDEIIFENKKSKLRKFRLHLPLYDTVTDLKIGINDDCEFLNSQIDSKKIVFYGTSITQGGCASRPGLSHTNIISRKTGYDCINYGFDGNGHLESSIGLILSKIKANFYLIDCLPNIDIESIKSNVINLIESIRSSSNSIDKPIVFIDQPDAHDDYFEEDIYEKNKTLRKQVKKALKMGHKYIYLIKSGDYLGADNEATVDGIHYNDIGYARFAQHIITELKRLDIGF
jgi:hypothetical protein